MSTLLQWIDNTISFPQMSFLRPVFAVAILLVVVDLTFSLIFIGFKRFFE